MHFAKTPTDAQELLVKQWLNKLETSSFRENLMLAFTRKAVSSLNEKAHAALQEKGFVRPEEFTYFSQSGEKALLLSQGERILFRQNNSELGIRNGDLATITKIDKQAFIAKLDTGEVVTTFLRHERYLGIQAIAKNQNMALYIQVKLGKQSNTVDFKRDYSLIKQEAERAGLLVEKLALSIKECQQAYRKERFNELKQQYPILVEYDKLLKEQRLASGYGKEKIEKSLSLLGTKILQDKKLFSQIKQDLPKLAKNFENRLISLSKDKEHIH